MSIHTRHGGTKVKQSVNHVINQSTKIKSSISRLHQARDGGEDVAEDYGPHEQRDEHQQSLIARHRCHVLIPDDKEHREGQHKAVEILRREKVSIGAASGRLGSGDGSRVRGGDGGLDGGHLRREDEGIIMVMGPDVSKPRVTSEVDLVASEDAEAAAEEVRQVE